MSNTETPLLNPLRTIDVKALTGKDGTFFRVGFHKRPKKLGKRALARGEIQPTKGEYREFTCRFGVRKDLKGGAPAYNRDEKNLLCVWVPEGDLQPEDAAKLGEDQNGDYRSIPCENVVVVKAHGRVWHVQDGMLIEEG